MSLRVTLLFALLASLSAPAAGQGSGAIRGAGGGASALICDGATGWLVPTDAREPAREVRFASPVADSVWLSKRRVFLVAAADRVVAIAPSGRQTELARLPGAARSIAVSPDETTVAVSTDATPNGVTVFRLRRGRLERVGTGVEARRAPGRVSLGDVDGDGGPEALVVVTGVARFDKHMRLRPFVYGWSGRRLYPKWLGSRLSRPFVDAALTDIDGDGRAEIVAVERTRDDAFELAAYRWKQFGFERIATSAPAAEIASFATAASGRVLALVDGRARAFALRSGALVPVAGLDEPAVAAVETGGVPYAVIARDGFVLRALAAPRDPE